MAKLVTGATGFVGSHIARKLAERGDELKLLVRKTSKTINIDDIKAERVYGDVTDIDSIRKALLGCDTLYHTASYPSNRQITKRWTM